MRTALFTGADTWIGVAKARCSIADELPLLLLPFAVPAAAVVPMRRRFLQGRDGG